MKPVIYIVDDDASVRRAMKRLIRSAGMQARTFSSAQEFLDLESINQNACMIVDIKLHGMSGLEFYGELRVKGCALPVIFITGFDTPETRHQAKKIGAAGYFRKPIDDQADGNASRAVQRMAGVTGQELWFERTVSDMARQNLKDRGWKEMDRIGKQLMLD